MSGGKPSPAKAAAKRKAAAAAAAAGSPGGAKKNKLEKGIGSLLARLEASNASFLQAAAATSMQTQLAKVTAAALAEEAARPTPSLASLASLASLPLNAAELARRRDRRERFQAEKAAAAAAAGVRDSNKTLVALRSEQGVAHGNSTQVEKEYLRLTSLPSAADVRPPEVLAQALELVKRRWTEGCEYKYACDQLKSIRQDLTVQHIRSRFTAQVYETHARIAIEVADWAEYRQCHSVLQQLYGDGIEGEQREFAAYGLLYAAASGAQAGNVVRFLRLYEGAPRMAPYLMDLLLGALRRRAYSTVLSSFQPSVPLASLSGWFGFSKRKEAVAFLRERGAVIVEGCLDIKQSRAAAARLAAAAEAAAQQEQLLPRR
ncbi:leukocyte receptor cluster member 8-like protein [Micractinium conductrix]|uniref:Leukocyte receptor cluster member 8-like protein n=1 Tax=Micractinium conductrix TaxID=554055 RepID=A0A2P6V9R9_9CHLO|nr:leukocyte receptor cluster member 8-like protein [Micractinium conductrix]|eukprot:PSC70843.1 leukocyte receptor cluster member 8-like protein [Micractinium conductrix]